MTDSAQMRAFGRSIDDFEPLSPAEEKLLAGCRFGRIVEIGGAPPRRGTRANRVRASFLRFLALGGDEEVAIHERGIQLMGAWITGILDLDSTRVDSPIGLARCRLERIEASDAHLNYFELTECRVMEGIAGNRLHCTGSLCLSGGTHISGGVNLVGASIGGNCDCSGSRFENERGVALCLDGASIRGDVRLCEEFHATGSVYLILAEIGGNLICTDGRFERSRGSMPAIQADGAKISGAAFLNGRFHSEGEVLFISAAIGAHLDCIGGLFNNDGGDALVGDQMKVAGNVVLHWPFLARGVVRLRGAKIGGNLECDGARFKGRTRALSCQIAVIDGSVFLRNHFIARGAVDLAAASIGRNLECHGAALLGRPAALICSGARVSGSFILNPRCAPGGLILAGMHVAELIDEGPARARGPFWLDGFTYGRFAGDAPTGGRERIAWLDAQVPDHLDADFRPQPWEQAIAVLRTMGHKEAARAVAIAKQERLREAGKIVYGAGWLHWLYGRLVGYGYRPHRVMISIAAVWFLCGLAYWAAANPAWFGASSHLVAPANTQPSSECLMARARARSGDPCPTPPVNYGNFVPFVYSADVLLPIISLGYKDEWRPVVADREGRPLVWGQLLRFVYWFEIAFGWVAGLLLAGVVGGLVKKD